MSVKINKFQTKKDSKSRKKSTEKDEENEKRKSKEKSKRQESKTKKTKLEDPKKAAVCDLFLFFLSYFLNTIIFSALEKD